MSPRALTVISAGLRQPSSTRLLADQLAAATRDEAGRRGVAVDVRMVELREHAHDITNHLLTGFPPAALRPAMEAVTSADGLIAVTPIFNASYAGLFKSFFDLFADDVLAGKPVLVAATGGTARHSLALDHALRPLFSYLRTLVLPTAVFAAPEDWAGATASGALDERVRQAAGELAERLAAELARPAAVDPFALTRTFDELLTGD
ncbi:FMN reductase [Plantactinospora sp. GCM10030261]|uniref:FMN reductase n=1 Tax=Plantactinospora sp. GCM10030261 TaxID=3273420 RepID=UPI003619949F